MPPAIDEATQERIAAQATAVVRDHFAALDRGDADAARAGLFVPPGADAAIATYLTAMAAMAPFQLLRCAPRRFEEFPRRVHGIAATVWVSVIADGALGERAADLTVWWYHADDRCLIATRPDAWVREHLAG
jgi:ketosteroid isomerase-like protein